MAAPSIILEFGDGDYCFSLPLPQQMALEEKCAFIDDRGWKRPKGILAIFSDTIAGLAVVDGTIVAVPEQGRASALETRQVVLQGLIGGGYGYVDEQRVPVDEIKARKLVEAYIDAAPMVRRWTLAAAILKSAIYDEVQEPVKKKRAPKAGGSSTRRSRRTSPASPQPAPL